MTGPKVIDPGALAKLARLLAPALARLAAAEKITKRAAPADAGAGAAKRTEGHSNDRPVAA